MLGTVNQRVSPRYLPKTNVGYVREKSSYTMGTRSLFFMAPIPGATRDWGILMI